MMDGSMLGVQSFCFRKFQPVSALIECLQEVGLNHVEIWPGHLSAEADDVEERIQEIREAGITIDSYGVVGPSEDEAEMRPAFEFCRLAGCRTLDIGAAPEETRATIEKLCDEYDINAAIHNHGRNHSYGSYEVLQEAFDATSPRIGLCLDTAWALDAGEDPIEGVERFADRLYGVHLKDFTFDAEGNHEDVIIGTGELDLPELMRRLEAVEFDGFLALEYEGNADDPLEEVEECARVVRKAIADLG